MKKHSTLCKMLDSLAIIVHDHGCSTLTHLYKATEIRFTGWKRCALKSLLLFNVSIEFLHLSSLLHRCFFKESSTSTNEMSMEHRFFRLWRIVKTIFLECLHRNHRCFINVASMLRSCLFKEQAGFFDEDIIGS